MLTSIRIQNFKAWRDTNEVRLAPLTVIFGPNSAGKSSIGHLLLALKQTASYSRRALHLGDANSLIDLGTFKDCIYDHDDTQPLSFKLRWNLPSPMQLEDHLHNRKRYSGYQLSLNVTISAGKTGQPEVAKLKYRLLDQDKESIDFGYERKPSSKEFEFSSHLYRLVRTEGRPWPLDEPEKFYRISDKSRAKFQNADFLEDFALSVKEMIDRFYYIGPLREYPRRIYQWSGDTPEDVGSKGEYAVSAMLAAKSHDRKLNRGPKGKGRLQPFDEFIASWLKDLGIINNFSVRPIAEGRKEYEVLVKTRSNSSEVKITDVGFGVSQVLPALVQAFYCPPNSVVWMEQPELHLHPQVQSELADAFIFAIKARENGKNRNVQLIVESHSEHFLNRLLRRVAEEKIIPDEIAIYFCTLSGKTAKLVPLEVDLFGDITNWPENFFGDEMAELTARTVAAMKRRGVQNR
jgi:predicted ATPase